MPMHKKHCLNNDKSACLFVLCYLFIRAVPSRNDPLLTPLVVAVRTQTMAIWRQTSSDERTCFFDEDPRHLNVLDIAPFTTMRRDLMQWQTSVSDTEACLDLHSPTRALPETALTDKSCPTFLLLDFLREGGWHPKARKIIHKLTDEGELNGKNSTGAPPNQRGRTTSRCLTLYRF